MSRLFQSFLVKPEPEETKIPTTAATSSSQQGWLYNVKQEPVNNPRLLTSQGPVNSQPTTVPMRKLEDELPRIPVASQPAVDDAPKPIFTIYNTPDEIEYSPEEALRQGLDMVKTIRDVLKSLELGSKLRQDVWNREMENLQNQGTPRTLIAVCGATGAGKSSILNAVLDDNVVPTSGMRACTAVVTEISYHKKSTIEADVSFLSAQEWKQELAVLLHDLVDEDGRVKRFNDLKSDAGVAWQKVNAVYPKISQEQIVTMSVDQIITHDIRISAILGTTKLVVANDSKSFAKEIGRYIDSKEKRGKKDKDKERGQTKEATLMDQVRSASGLGRTESKAKSSDLDCPALWPLIRQVNVRCRSKALSTGAVLVDLPGVADANAARNNIAKDYMKKCNCIWILAPITRAVDDKTARDLLGDAFKMQLMNGNYDDHAITFIASKCDDISCSEVIRALALDDDPEFEVIDSRLNTLKKEASIAKRRKKDAEAHVKDIDTELKGVRERQRDFQDHLQALQNGEAYESKFKATSNSSNNKKRKKSGGQRKRSPKRRRSHGNDSDSDDSIIEDDSESESDSDGNDSDSDDNSSSDNYSDDGDGIQSDSGSAEEVTEESLKEKIKDSREKIKSVRERLSEARAAKKEAADILASLDKKIIKAQREKNAFCALKRNEFSRGVLKEDFRAGLKDLDDAAAEERDPDNFNPNANIRDYAAIDLPVFTCSSRDYVRLKGQVKGDGEPACFSNVEDTGVPSLQKWCHQLTVASRERSARTFLTHLQAFALSIQTYVRGIGDVTAIDREALREQWESRGFNDPDNFGLNADVDPLDAIMEGLGGGFGAGLYAMNKPVAKVDAYGRPTGIAPKLCAEFAKLVDECVANLQRSFKEGLEEKCRVGATNAAEAALTTLDEFTGSMHWATYRATLRRHGSWRRDLNVELINPFTRSIAHSWSKVFESDLFAPFLESTITAINDLAKDVEASAAPGLKDRARLQGEQSVEEARVTLLKTVENVKETVTQQQKEISRCMAPHVQAQLVEGYDTAMEERGIGSVARQKAYFRRFLDECKSDIFEGGADVVMGRLEATATAVGETLDEAMGKLAEKVEVSLAVLWEGLRDSPAQTRARKATVDIMETIQTQIQFWTEAGGRPKGTMPDDDAMEED